MIGPYNQDGSNDGFYAITMIEPVLRWIEIHPLKPKTALNAAQTFDDNWLCRYPRPLYCVGAEIAKALEDKKDFDFSPVMPTIDGNKKTTTTRTQESVRKDKPSDTKVRNR